jgi:hypothetical protein
MIRWWFHPGLITYTPIRTTWYVLGVQKLLIAAHRQCAISAALSGVFSARLEVGRTEDFGTAEHRVRR